MYIVKNKFKINSRKLFVFECLFDISNKESYTLEKGMCLTNTALAPNKFTIHSVELIKSNNEQLDFIGITVKYNNDDDLKELDSVHINTELSTM